MGGEVQVGSVLADRFQLLEKLGEGLTGRVYRAFHPQLCADVAIKVLKPTDDDGVRRFAREAEAASRLEHPHCVRLFEIGHDESSGARFLVMELVDGHSLKEALARATRLAPARACRMAAQVASALAEAHRAGVIHRDIKPGNVLIAADGPQPHVKVCDFGLAKLLAADAQAYITMLTRHGAVMGTPKYMAPEQARGETVTPASDVYALGATLYRMIAGVAPHDEPTPQALLQRHVRGEPSPPLAERVPDVDRRLAELVAGALRLEAEARPPAAELARALAALAPDLPDRSPVAPAPAPPPRPVGPKLRFGALAKPAHTRKLDFAADLDPAAAPPPPRPAALPLTVREWTLIDRIGRGGSGIVYRARHAMLDGEYAIKVPDPAFAQDHDARQRFLREAALVVSIDHPNVVRCMAPFEEGDAVYLPMELLSGETLDELLHRSPGPRPAFESVEMIRQAALGAGAVHQRGILHRDLKPSNLFVVRATEPPRIKVLDFGIAKLVGQQTLTQTGAIVGTPMYLAPEILRGEPASPRGDVYALGIVLYRLLTGKMPFSVPDSSRGMWAVIGALMRAHEDGIPPVAQHGSAPPALDELVRACLSADPDVRPADGDALAEALGWSLDDQVRPGDIRSLLAGQVRAKGGLLASAGRDLAWQVCATCGLKHRGRSDGRCPRCGQAAHGGEVQTRGPGPRYLWPVAIAAVVSAVLLSVSILILVTADRPRATTASAPTPSTATGDADAGPSTVPSLASIVGDAIRSATPKNPLALNPLIASREPRMVLGGIRTAQESFRAAFDAYSNADPEGPGRPPAEYFSDGNCSPKCGRANSAACRSFSCIGFRPPQRVVYRYACNAYQARGEASEFTCAASADLDGDGRSKMFVFGTANRRGTNKIVAPIPAIGDTGACAVGKTNSYEVVDCNPNEW